MMRRHSIAVLMGSVLILLLVGGTILAGAQAAQVPAASPVVPVVRPGRPAATTAPAAVPAVPPDYRYSPAGKPDPFKPFLEMDAALKMKKEEGQKKKAAAIGRPISPLQQAELGQFRLLGIAGDENKRAAIVAAGTTNKFYPVFVGTYIGMNEGRVVAILPDRLLVEERAGTQDKKTKRVQVKKITVLLHKEQ